MYVLLMSIVADGLLAPTFDPRFYRETHSDLNLGNDAAAVRHYEESGRTEGRLASPMARREGLLDRIDTGRPTLEIGPFCHPLVRGDAVRYLDRLDAAELHARAMALGLDPDGCPTHIHFVGGFDKVEAGYFDNVVASHSIEHQPDLVRHLQDVANALKVNGRYYLVVPDKRFCFDHFLSESTIADILDAFDEERTVHRLCSVVEHVALVTHNDPVRHWNGDHGAVTEAEQNRRTAEAIDAYRRSAGGYIDVHAWQFTPASFRGAMQALVDLGLSAFEVEAVYDTPRDRSEFCAVLRRTRLVRRSPRRRHGLHVLISQSADPFRSARNLAVTAPNVTEYCRRHGLLYESFVGVKRGCWDWQASFNRIVVLHEQIERNYLGWVVCVEADAYIHDLDFDLPSYLRKREQYGVIVGAAETAGETPIIDPNVVIVNCRHPAGRRLITLWTKKLDTLSQDFLLAASDAVRPDGRDWLQAILREDDEVVAALLVDSNNVFGSVEACFVRQFDQSNFASAAEHLLALRHGSTAALRAAGVAHYLEDGAGSRDSAALLHHLSGFPWLAEAPPGTPCIEAATRAIERVRAESPMNSDPVTAMLTGDDVFAVANEFASFGRSPAARGFLGGDRQHARCQADPVFAHQRALRTHDALLSLAELIGALQLENPDLGPWGVTPKIASAELFKAIERTLGFDLAPPPTIGAYLGVRVAPATVLHLRMIEAIFAVWRVDQVAALIGAKRVREIGGGIGLTRWYAKKNHGRLSYLVTPPSVAAGALQDYITGEIEDRADVDKSIDLIFLDDVLQSMGHSELLEHLQAADKLGARAILSFGQEALAVPGSPSPIFENLLAEIGGWTRRWRGRHGLKAGHVEEIYLRN